MGDEEKQRFLDEKIILQTKIMQLTRAISDMGIEIVMSTGKSEAVAELKARYDLAKGILKDSQDQISFIEKSILSIPKPKLQVTSSVPVHRNKPPTKSTHPDMFINFEDTTKHNPIESMKYLKNQFISAGYHDYEYFQFLRIIIHLSDPSRSEAFLEWYDKTILKIRSDNEEKTIDELWELFTTALCSYLQFYDNIGHYLKKFNELSQATALHIPAFVNQLREYGTYARKNFNERDLWDQIFVKCTPITKIYLNTEFDKVVAEKGANRAARDAVELLRNGELILTLLERIDISVTFAQAREVEKENMKITMSHQRMSKSPVILNDLSDGLRRMSSSSSPSLASPPLTLRKFCHYCSKIRGVNDDTHRIATCPHNPENQTQKTFSTASSSSPTIQSSRFERNFPQSNNFRQNSSNAPMRLSLSPAVSSFSSPAASSVPAARPFYQYIPKPNTLNVSSTLSTSSAPVPSTPATPAPARTIAFTPNRFSPSAFKTPVPVKSQFVKVRSVQILENGQYECEVTEVPESEAHHDPETNNFAFELPQGMSADDLSPEEIDYMLAQVSLECTPEPDEEQQ